MPSGKNRHRVEISEERYRQLAAMAAREGYTVTAFLDRLLGVAMAEYVGTRQQQRHPLASWLGGTLRGFCR